MSEPWLFRGTIGHRRREPCPHGFAYPAFFICFPLDDKATLRTRLFSVNRSNLFSFHDADHGDGIDSEAWARGLLTCEGLSTIDGRIWLHTMPRLFGFVFNPVSFWYCHDRAGALRAVICEVNNTFGERHCYLLTAPDGGIIGNDQELRAQKAFHVSPFFPVQGEYRFRFHQDGERRVAIDYYEGSTLLLETALSGHPLPLCDRSLLQLLFSLGWSTLLVVLRIHWQALQLWRKGAIFHRKPLPPSKEITR